VTFDHLPCRYRRVTQRGERAMCYWYKPGFALTGTTACEACANRRPRRGTAYTGNWGPAKKKGEPPQ
jgi:hypothetical protein